MTPLYIVLYLVVGLIVKWTIVDRRFKESADGELGITIVVFWFIPVLIELFFRSVDLADEYIYQPYTRIRKFFRGF